MMFLDKLIDRIGLCILQSSYKLYLIFLLIESVGQNLDPSAFFLNIDQVKNMTF